MSAIKVRQLVLALLALDLVVFAGHLLLSRHPFLGVVFDLDSEANLPTWYSSFKFALAAAAAAFCYHAERASGGEERFRWGWIVVALLMLCMSLDETAQVHEALTNWLVSGRVGENLRAAFGATEETDSLLWGIIFSPVLLLVAVGSFLFYFTRFRVRASLLVWAVIAVGLLGASLVLETREAALLSTQGFVSRRQWALYKVYVAVEELVELLAGTVLVAVHYAYGTLTLRRG